MAEDDEPVKTVDKSADGAIDVTPRAEKKDA
jgi:hypothetical protein